MKRVVVTGIGIYSCLGTNIQDVANALYAGRSGIGIDLKRTEYGYRSPLTGLLSRPDLKGLLDRRIRTCLAEQGEYAYISTLEALNKAEMDTDYLAANEAGIIFGNDSCAEPIIKAHTIASEQKDTTLVGAGQVFQTMTSTVSMNLATIFNLRGINFTVGAACASSSHAIGLGTTFIRNGMQEIVICGGAQETNYLSMSSFDGISAFSTRTDEPTKASRPFDVSRDGLVPSGGAATLILEEYEHAKKRSAPILAEVVGYGFSSNGTNIQLPSVNGSATAMQRALQNAHLCIADVDYINAHATSTPQGDATEAKAIYQIFGRCQTPVSSTKSMTGHECWMAGASEAVYSILMMQHDFIAPNINLEQPDADAQKLNIITQTAEKNINIILSNSFGFGGTNSVLILKKTDFWK